MSEDEHPSVLHEVAKPELTDAEAGKLLADLNDKRCADLEAKTNGQVQLEHAFDFLRLLTFIEHIALTMGVTDKSEVDFQGRRSDMLDDIEAQYAQMMAAREVAERQARLAGGPTGRRAGVPQRPGPGGIVVPGR